MALTWTTLPTLLFAPLTWIERLTCGWHGHAWLTTHDTTHGRVYLVCRKCLTETRGWRVPNEREIRCRL